MGRLIRIAFLLGICLVGASAFAEVRCETYYNTVAYSDAQYNFCWLSGAICYQCYDVDTAESCSNDFSPCEPRRRFHKDVLASLFDDKKKATSPCVAASLEQKEQRLRVDDLL